MDADKFEKAIAERETICRTLKEMGFLYITLDLEAVSYTHLDGGAVPRHRKSAGVIRISGK